MIQVDCLLGVGRDGVVWVTLLGDGQCSGYGWRFETWGEALAFCESRRYADWCERWLVVAEPERGA